MIINLYPKINNDWDFIIKDEVKKPYFIDLMEFLRVEYVKKCIYPPARNLYDAFKYTSYNKTKVVILGQDPYHAKGYAHGMAFSVNKYNKIPPSLKNVFVELYNDLEINMPNHGYLIHWANQGVLLLNSVLSVEDGKAKSHNKIGWENFTNFIISQLNKKDMPIVFLLWGGEAQKKKKFITNDLHKIICSAHPSPLSFGKFFGSKPFSKTNEFLSSCGLQEIDWHI